MRILTDIHISSQNATIRNYLKHFFEMCVSGLSHKCTLTKSREENSIENDYHLFCGTLLKVGV